MPEPKDEEEAVVAFDKGHYPDGLNANFKTNDVHMLAQKYAGKLLL